jgi:hypothetical protein
MIPRIGKNAAISAAALVLSGVGALAVQAPARASMAARR